MRKPVVGVMGGSKASESVHAMARELGRLIAQRGWVLLNGGRNQGVMAASAKGAREAGGLVVGVLPDKSDKRASPDLDVAIMTGLGDGRNLINVLSSDVVIACPGALGTLSEIIYALKHQKTVILLAREPDPSLERYARKGQVLVARDPAEAVTRAAAVLAEQGSA
ncbi:MAG: TIGR00725 family protein [Planctomycetes bacterium]|nr:TIGR00725 family protein [Planctomycetota bacterium]